MDPSTDDKEQDSNVSRTLLSSQWNPINQVTDSRTAAEPYRQLHKGESPGGDGSYCSHRECSREMGNGLQGAEVLNMQKQAPNCCQ